MSTAIAIAANSKPKNVAWKARMARGAAAVASPSKIWMRDHAATLFGDGETIFATRPSAKSDFLDMLAQPVIIRLSMPHLRRP